MIAELDQEAETTRRYLERVPDDKLTWRPHPKSMTLGQLALHVATLCGGVSGFLEVDSFDVTGANFDPEQPASRTEILGQFDAMQALAKSRLEALGDEQAMADWKLMKGDDELWCLPKVGLARALMFNHLYHHRGQLSVYLRLLDVPVPVAYGKSADENPFA
jgi:uncharacterized damage-inducible protein DinB